MKAMSSTHVARFGKQVGDPLARLAILLELPLGPDDPPLVLLAAPAEGLDGDRLAVERIELGLVVERIDMAGPAVHEQKDDALGLGGELRRLGRQRVDERRHAVGRHGLTVQKPFGSQQAP